MGYNVAERMIKEVAVKARLGPSRVHAHAFHTGS